MAADSLHVGLEPRAVAAGDVITGVVTLRLSKPRVLTDLHVEFLGEGSVYWTEYGYFYGNMSRYREYARSWSTAVTPAQPRVAAVGAGADTTTRIPGTRAVAQPPAPAAPVAPSDSHLANQNGNISPTEERLTVPGNPKKLAPIKLNATVRRQQVGRSVVVPSKSPLPGAPDNDDDDVNFAQVVRADRVTVTQGTSTKLESDSHTRDSETLPSNGVVPAENVTNKKAAENGNVRVEKNVSSGKDRRIEVEWDPPENDFDTYEVRSRGPLPLHFSGNEMFLKRLVTLIPASAGGRAAGRKAAAAAAAVSDRTLGAGRHAFPFRVPLPQDLPPSFEGRHGHVRYSARARLLVAARPPLEAIANFLVTQPPSARAVSHKERQGPISARRARRPWPTLCVGPVAATLQLPTAELLAGGRVRCSVTVENRSRKDVTAVVCALKKVTDLYAQLPYKEHLRDEVTLARQALGRVPSKGCGHWTPELTVPDAPPGFRAGRVVHLHYVMQVDVTVANMSSNLCVQLPVTLWRTDDSP